MPRGRPAKKGRNGPKKKQPFNVVDFSFGLVAANAVTQATFGTGLKTFLTEGWGEKGMMSHRSDNSWEITLGELFTKPNSGIHEGYRSVSGFGGFTAAVETNLRRHGIRSGITLLVLPTVKKFVKKGISPLTRPINRLLENNQIKAVKV